MACDLQEAVHNAVLLITTSSTAEPLEGFVFRLDYILPTPDRRDRDLEWVRGRVLPPTMTFADAPILFLRCLSQHPGPADITGSRALLARNDRKDHGFGRKADSLSRPGRSVIIWPSISRSCHTS